MASSESESMVGEEVCSRSSKGAAARWYTTQQQQQQQQEELQHHQPQLGTVSHLLTGGVAGAVSKACTARLACLTILFQAVASDAAWSQKNGGFNPDVGLDCGGGLSGVPAASMAYTLDLVHTRLTAQPVGPCEMPHAIGRCRWEGSCLPHGGFQNFWTYYPHTEGFRGMHRGILPEYCKVVSGVYHMLKAILTGLESDD